ncbi:MAG: PDZ domain-containing protein [Planctomycetota bacterium]
METVLVPTENPTMTSPFRALLLVCLLVVVTGDAFAQGRRGRRAEGPQQVQPVELSDAWLEDLGWRSIGPATMGGRIVAFAVHPDDASTYWVATASGGLLKTVNAGMTYEHQFDHESSVSIGHVAVAPSNPDVVWVGTGEANPRNSVSYGDGVHKSVDGGATWKHMGLAESFQTGRIAIHPSNPDVVYVGALGRLYGPNDERGLYRTKDGGETWERILYVDENTGVIDVELDPSNPDVVIAATYERRRDGFDTNQPAQKWGPGGGLWRSEDAGATWTRLSKGLPTVQLGRIGVDWYRADPKVVYAVVETERISRLPDDTAFMGMSGENAEVGAKLTSITEGGPAEAAELRVGDVVTGADGERVLTYVDLVRAIRRHKAGETMQVEYVRERELFHTEVTFGPMPEPEEDEGEDPYDEDALHVPELSSGLGGQRENVQDRQGYDANETGGVFRSDDHGVTWTRINSLNPRPMYYSQIRVDPSDSNHVYVCGTELYQSHDGGKTFTSDGAEGEVHVDHHALWIDPRDGRHIMLGNDGGIYVSHDRMETWDHHNHVAIGQFYHVTTDTKELYSVYGGLQDNGSWGAPNRTRTRTGVVNGDWIEVGGGDGFVCRVDPNDPDQIYTESQNGGMGWRNLRTGERGSLRPRPPQGERYRFNWNTPFLLSSFNSRIVYTAGNKVFRSLDRGAGMEAISPEITLTDRGSATALAEDPRDHDTLYVGTDDGALWATHDGGTTWIDLLHAESEGGGEVATDPLSAATRQVVTALDADGDGRVASSEVPELFAGFVATLDTDGDGELDAEEIEAATRSKAEPAPERGPTGEWTARVDAIHALTDDGSLDLDLALADGVLTGSCGGVAEVRDGSWDGRSGRASLVNERGASVGLRIFTIDGDELVGSLDVHDALASVVVRGTRDGSATGPAGRWKLVPIAASAAGSGEGFGLTFGERGDRLTGEFRAKGGEGRVRQVAYDGATKVLSFVLESQGESSTVVATVGRDELVGTFSVAGLLEVAFAAERAAPAADDEGDGSGGRPLLELVPGPMWVSSIVASKHVDGRVYLTLDGHRSDDDSPWIFVSDDRGATWSSLRGELPRGSTRVVAEDLENPNMLYLGTEFGAWFSLDRGRTWLDFGKDLPTVAVHDFAQHESSGEIVAATHGRSLWVLDTTVLRQITPETLADPVHLYRPRAAVAWRSEVGHGASGTRRFVGENPSNGIDLVYSLARDANEIALRIEGLDGEAIVTLEAPKEAGVHRVEWNLRGPGRATSRGFMRFGAPVPTGTYRAVLEVDGESRTQPLEIRVDPERPDGVTVVEEEYLEDVEEYEGEPEEDEGPKEVEGEIVY